jgi:hypothetical protein
MLWLAYVRRLNKVITPQFGEEITLKKYAKFVNIRAE